MTEYIPPNVPLYLTPDSIPSGVFCRTLGIPDDPTWCALVDGALTPLMQASAWRPFGAVTPQEAADAWRAMLYASDAGALTCDMIETPYWDDESDVGDSETADMQTWYGSVTNPDAPPDELDFVENAIVWFFTGLIALATPELGFAPAILFHTIAPSFIIAQKRGDFATVINIVVNGQKKARVDTTSNTAGDIIEIPVVPDASEGGYDLLIYNTLP